MRKILALLLTIGLCLSIVGCGDKYSKEEKEWMTKYISTPTAFDEMPESLKSK